MNRYLLFISTQLAKQSAACITLIELKASTCNQQDAINYSFRIVLEQ